MRCWRLGVGDGGFKWVAYGMDMDLDLVLADEQMI